ncbi:MAG: PKD domain-containing protein, partial [Planctomycetes bacterium]|nr:PKD domain-containing protein [Planctomycetota bacterium]
MAGTRLYFGKKQSLLVTLFCCTSMTLAGCGGSGSTTTDGPTASTADCSSISSDALVSVDDDASNSLLAAAVTSDCDEVAVFEDDGRVSQAAVSLKDGSIVVAEFNDSGEVVAVRSGGDTLTFSYNDSLGFARGEFTSSSGESSASVFSIGRDSDSTAARSSAQNGGFNAAFCDEMKQFSEVLTAACEAAPTAPYCGQAMDRASKAAAKLCSDNVEELSDLEGTTLGEEEREFALGVDGFVTARPAANNGTTFIGSSEAFGGRPPYEITWTVTSTPTDASATVSDLPGGAAVVDATTNTGEYGFRVSVTDANGDLSTDDILFVLGDEEFFGARIVASDEDPNTGAEVSFKAVVQGFGTTDGTTGGTALEPGTIYWDLGDGTSETGETISHTYTEAGVYEVYLVVIAGAECDFSDTVTIVVGGGGDQKDEGGFVVEITASADSMNPGETITLIASSTGAIEPVEYGWDIINEEGFGIAQLNEIHSTLTAQSFFTEIVELDAFAEGIVQVGLLAVDATGRVAVTIKSIPIFGDGGGLFAAIEGPLELEVGVAGTLQPFVVGGEGAMRFDWYIEADPFSSVDDTATISDPRASQPEIIAHEPGFLGVGVVVTDSVGNEANAFLGIFVFAEGFDDLFVEFLGPYEVPVGEIVPLHSFIVGGEEPYFCSWHIVSSSNSAFVLDPFQCFETTMEFAEPGCVDMEVVVEDIAGAVGFSVFTVCAGDSFAFECPFDDFCDPECPGFDPDCEDPCPLDGFCDDLCQIGDPDCFEEIDYCSTGDGFCDDFCSDFGAADTDCDHCGKDGVCVFFCPGGEDPDCHREFCVSGDGLCDFGCVPEDSDCADMFCQSGDGFCDFPCDVPDPDCGTNAEYCAEFFYCCEDDGFCDGSVCPEPDADCNNCGQDGLCVYECATADPDCDELSDCASDFDCDDFDSCTYDVCDFGWCAYDVDPNCSQGGGCFDDFDCDDFDTCTFDFCDVDGLCKFDMDPQCAPTGDCGDGVCDSLLGEDSTTCAVDCAAGHACGDG